MLYVEHGRASPKRYSGAGGDLAEQAQEKTISVLLSIERELTNPYILTDKDRAAIERGLDDLRHRRFATDEEVVAVFKRYRQE